MIQGGIIKKCTLSTVNDNNDNIYCNQGSYWEEHENSFLFTDDNCITNNLIDKQKDNVNDTIYRMMNANNDSSPSFLMKRYQNDIFQKEKKENTESFNNLNYSLSESLDLCDDIGIKAEEQIEMKEKDIDDNDQILMCMLYLPLDAISNSS